eukprot:11180246-Alexandrium_andersonii.AAC.1
MCPCNLQRRGECVRCGRPCEHGRWVRVRGCDLCGVRACAEADADDPVRDRDEPWTRPVWTLVRRRRGGQTERGGAARGRPRRPAMAMVRQTAPKTAGGGERGGEESGRAAELAAGDGVGARPQAPVTTDGADGDGPVPAEEVGGTAPEGRDGDTDSPGDRGSDDNQEHEAQDAEEVPEADAGRGWIAALNRLVTVPLREVFDEGEQRNRVPETVAQQLVRATLPLVTLTPNADRWVTDRGGHWEATTIIAHDVGGRERAIQL